MLSSPDDWVYLAEGGKHVIFRHRDEHIGRKHGECGTLADTTTNCFYGRVLRIQKSELAMAAQVEEASCQRRNDRFELKESRDSLTSSERFRRLIVGPILGSCYLDSPNTLFLPAPFCHRLYQNAISSGDVPSSRLSSWETQQQQVNVNNPQLNEIKATLLPNHTVMKLHPLFVRTCNDSYPTILSVEIKPKAGYLAESPLVLPDHRCKYYHTRYSLQQTLMERGIVKKGWCRQKEQHKSVDDGDSDTTTQHNFTRSNYSPLDLFSGNLMQMEGALRELSKNMQNNFCVWCNGSKIFGEYESFPSAKYSEILHDLFRMHPWKQHLSEARSILLDVIVDVVAKILHRETLLENLLCLQLLDVIDGDGAVLVYKRLVSLCNGSHSEAEMAVEQNFIPLDASWSSSSPRRDCGMQDLFACSPYQPPEDTRLRLLLNEIQQFRTHLRYQRQAGFDADEATANTFHSSCVHHVKHLSKESCIYLLSNWLLSLTMCDVSFFVTFYFWEVSDSDDLNEEMLIERNQTEDISGLFVCKIQNIGTSPNTMIRYQVKVVDCDPKPAIKLRGRDVVEKNFQFCF
ncbi:hypothetical protein HJC23_011289 [Cyclotella cryptica]|uniref:Inositol-pentakisphosphate 2-kinase n=1 Tax=Cyclotella cryptica TaxID=29204 RepID=A0ABD3QX08_9STRA|eukprot:CCRYP_001695-RA/>CCRYP_001695-RA protein AED:0.00 eAED:0.00 QI:325/-1/1/1/-1/1/1/1089/572